MAGSLCSQGHRDRDQTFGLDVADDLRGMISAAVGLPTHNGRHGFSSSSEGNGHNLQARWPFPRAWKVISTDPALVETEAVT